MPLRISLISGFSLSLQAAQNLLSSVSSQWPTTSHCVLRLEITWRVRGSRVIREKKSCQKEEGIQQAVVVQAFNPGTGEAEIGRSL